MGVGFGANNNSTSSPFGGAQKPAFGAPATTSSGGGLFGGSTNNTSTSGGFGGGGGGFGGSTNTGGFGGGAASGELPRDSRGVTKQSHTDTAAGLFGQNKPATIGFGATNSGGSLFGGGNTAGGFGSSTTNTANPFSTNTNTANTTTGFGASNAGGGGFTFGGAAGTANNSNNGTAGTPFQAFSEKDSPSSAASSAYQSITFQAPYANKSFEELRTEDYAQGRRFGNSNGQAGSFGQSTGFGGFGANNNASTGGGMFGNNNTATAAAGSTGFGASTGGFGSTNTTGFGGNSTNTGGGLFGQNKPATGGGLFGGSTTSGAATGGFGSTTNSGGGLFGGGGGAFGNTTNQGNTGGGLFGANNNQQTQNKTAFGGFGGSTTNATGGFGSTNTGSNLFGNTNNANTGGGLFGQNSQQQQQQNSNPFGGASTNTGGGLFGGTQAKPATGGGLFGNANNTNTGGGLFGGQNNQQQQQSNPFGGATNTGGGLFGNQNQNKPATGGGLFGGSTNTNTGGGLFGAQNNQQQQGGSSLFGGASTNTGGGLFGNQNKPAGNLFGGSTNNANQNNSLSLFGRPQQNQPNNGGSLFGGSLGQNQNQQSTNANSLFGGSLGQSSQQGAGEQQLHASLTDAPYGHQQLFANLTTNTPPVGPLSTPLNGAKAAARKTPSLLAGSRLNTPVYSPRSSTLGRNGYGFSYSTYGTPGSAFTSGSLTPGASSLLRPTGSLGSALTSRLNKSQSLSNLRGDPTPGSGGSLLRPNPFSPDGTPGRYQSGSMRKLKIDRSLRTDLFGQGESKAIEAAKEADGHSLRKRVSFENASAQGTTAEPSASNALVRTEDQDENEPSGASRAGQSKQPQRQQPEMEQVNGSALTTVPEDTEAPRPSSAPGTKVTAEKASKRAEAGDYWTKPAMKDLKNMSRQQLKSVGNFVVGREGVGRIEFGSVDLTNTPLDDICGNIVQLNPRSATVYQDDHDKPSMGKALNVPSTIYLEKLLATIAWWEEGSQCKDRQRLRQAHRSSEACCWDSLCQLRCDHRCMELQSGTLYDLRSGR